MVFVTRLPTLTALEVQFFVVECMVSERRPSHISLKKIFISFTLVKSDVSWFTRI